MKSLGGLVVLVLFLIAAPGPAVGQEVTVASKTFTESVVLGELLSALIRDSGAASRHRRELGGTRILWS
ncbi:MAG: amino acid ABC transporter permease, partial [Nitrospinaceae bacterium]|nr:amino acid ABC transporter permease [Nitrospinaceae bacterium]